MAELAADMGLAEARGLNQGSHILGALLELTEQLQTGRLTQQTEKLAEFLEQLRTRFGPSRGHARGFCRGRIMHRMPS